jgi:hypothetical protein
VHNVKGYMFAMKVSSTTTWSNGAINCNWWCKFYLTFVLNEAMKFDYVQGWEMAMS